jgi:hypothetical protein
MAPLPSLAALRALPWPPNLHPNGFVQLRLYDAASRSRELHDNYADGLTATLLEKLPVVPGSARVLVPAGAPPSQELFELDVPVEALWRQIEQALALAEEGKCV